MVVIYSVPKVVVKQLPLVKGRKVMYAEDSDNLLETIDDNNIDKTLILPQYKADYRSYYTVNILPATC